MARRNSQRRKKQSFQQTPWHQPRFPFPPMTVVSDDELERIHEASLSVIEDIGLDFLDPEARDLLRRHGADVAGTGERVRMDRGMVLDAVAKAPSSFTLHARNPAHNLTIGDNWTCFGAVSSPPNCSDLVGGRRVGNWQDYTDFIRLSQCLNTVHFIGGYPVEPVDRPPESRHLDCVQAMHTLCDKPAGAYALGAERISDAIEMAAIARGRTREQLKSEPCFMTVINTSSPLRVDLPMLQGMREAAEGGQVVIVTPFTLSGAMSPVTIAGALVQQNAEALATIACQQIMAPGAPVVYGGFTSNVDMKSGAPAFGTPEYTKAVMAGGQLARRYGLPYRSSNVNASNAADSQATYESMMSIWAVILAGGNVMKHALGWQEGGLCASFEKMIMDAEMLQGMVEFLKPLKVDDDEMALDAIADVGPGGHFFGTQHTVDRFETAFYAPLLSDWRNFESWEEAGSVTAEWRAHAIYKQLLEEFEPPAIDPGIADGLDEYVARRKEEIHGRAA